MLALKCKNATRECAFTVSVAPAEDGLRCSFSGDLLLDGVEEAGPARAEEDEQQHEVRRHGEDIILIALVGCRDGEPDGVERADESRRHEAEKVALLRHENHHASQHNLAQQVDGLPPVPTRLVLSVEEGCGA